MSQENPSKDQGGKKVVADNKKARFAYHIDEVFEAGIVLSGPEIKAIRAGGVNLSDSYISPMRGELWLVNAHISPYTFNADPLYQPTRRRKILMHKMEIERLTAKAEQKNFTIVPLQMYLQRGRAKLSVALAKGKDAPDKRRTTRERELNREAERAMKSRR
jgi:SsrA-binding protein